jgi:hypothetical protein
MCTEGEAPKEREERREAQDPSVRLPEASEETPEMFDASITYLDVNEGHSCRQVIGR